jgi:hypothetical protein
VEGEGRKHAAAGANTPTCATAQRKSGARRAGRPSTPERSHSTQARPNVKARKTPVSCRRTRSRMPPRFAPSLARPNWLRSRQEVVSRVP